MAVKFLTNVDLNKNQTLNRVAQNLASAPSSPVVGQEYYDTTTNSTYFWDGTAWITTDARKATGIPNTALTTNPLARANHTGTQLAATVSDFDTQVRTSTLNQMTAPTADLSINSKKLLNVLDPVGAQDAATKNYVDGAVQSAAAGIDSKPSVRLIGTANLTLSGTQTIDSVAAVAGDRVLAQNQTTASQNGVYVVAAGAWTRAVDADQTGEITPGSFWFVEEGTVNNKTQWRCNNTGAITLGSTAITIVQFGAANSYTASNGVQLVGSDFSSKLPANSGLTADATGLYINRVLVPNKFTQSVGDGSATAIVVTHNLNTRDAEVAVVNASTPWDVQFCDVEMTSVNTTTLRFAVAPASNALRVVIIG